MNIKPEISQIIAVYLALFLFGILYDSVICFALLRKWLEGFTWVAAIFGVLVTLIGASFLIGFENGLLAGGAFSASGLIVCIGAIIRYIKARDYGKKGD